MTDTELDRKFRDFLSQEETRKAAAILCAFGNDDDKHIMLCLLHSAFINGAQAGASMTLGQFDAALKNWGEP